MDDASRAENDGARSCRLPDVAERAAATAPLSLLVGAHLALLAVRHVMGLPVDGKIKVIDGAGGLVGAVAQARDRTCPYHRVLPEAQEVAQSNRATVGELMALLGAGAVPLAWRPFRIGAQCRRCGFGETRSGRLERGDCPQCGGGLRVKTQLEIDRAGADTPLQALGIAPREIVAVRGGDSVCAID